MVAFTGISSGLWFGGLGTDIARLTKESVHRIDILETEKFHGVRSYQGVRD